MNYCTICGAPVWILKGGGVYTCKRGHHHPAAVEPIRSTLTSEEKREAIRTATSRLQVAATIGVREYR